MPRTGATWFYLFHIELVLLSLSFWKCKSAQTWADTSEGNLSITHVNLVWSQGTVSEHTENHTPHESSSVGIHKMYTLQTSACYFSYHVYYRPQPPSTLLQLPTPISDKPTYTASLKYIQAATLPTTSLHKKYRSFQGKAWKVVLYCILLNI